MSSLIISTIVEIKRDYLSDIDILSSIVSTIVEIKRDYLSSCFVAVVSADLQ